MLAKRWGRAVENSWRTRYPWGRNGKSFCTAEDETNQWRVRQGPRSGLLTEVLACGPQILILVGNKLASSGEKGKGKSQKGTFVCVFPKQRVSFYQTLHSKCRIDCFKILIPLKGKGILKCKFPGKCLLYSKAEQALIVASGKENIVVLGLFLPIVWKMSLSLS